MFELTNDVDVFRRFWKDEKLNSPKHRNDANQTGTTTEEDFLGFCDNCERVYLIDNNVLIYVERVGEYANVHISVIRGETVDISILQALSDELLKDYKLMFAWVGKHSKGLKKVIEQCGFGFDGLTMFYGESHGKVLEWHCYIQDGDEQK